MLQEKRKNDISRRTFWVLVVALVLVKIALSRAQELYVWVGGAPIDDELMFRTAQSITAGQWLGAYDWLTLSKHMLFALWAALCHALHIPYLTAGQLLVCGAALACAQAFAPVLRKYWQRLAVFALLAFNPAASAAFTLRFYRDNIFPAVCMFFFAGVCGYALRCRQPLKRGIFWLVLAGLGLAAAWLTREDGLWLLPFALVGGGILLITAWRETGPVTRKLARTAVLAVPFVLLYAGIWGYSAMNAQHYGVFTVSDFSGGGFAEAMGAMNRVESPVDKPLVSVPEEVRRQLYVQVPAFAPLEPWLEEDKDLRNSYCNPKIGDYQAGAFYWAVRRAAAEEGVYDSAPTAEAYWQQIADQINAACDSGALPSTGGKRVGTTPPIRMEHVVPTLLEGGKSFWYVLTFQDCLPYEAELMSLGLPEQLAVWENYLGSPTNSVAQAGTALPYYHPLKMLVYKGMNLLRWGYALLLPVLFAAAAVLQVRRGLALLALRKAKAIRPGQALLWALLFGLFGMALLRCMMIAFMEVSSFHIGTYVMYLSTVHPLLLLFSAVGCLTELPGQEAR